MISRSAIELINDAANSQSESLDLTGMNLKTLPPEIAKLKNFKILKCGKIGLEEIPQEISELKLLEELYLSGNPLKKLPPEIGGLKSLRKLFIRNTEIRIS